MDTPEPRALLQRTFLGHNPLETMHSPYVSPASPKVMRAFYGDLFLANVEELTIDALDAAARARFLGLNEAYRARFGIPFVMAVRDRSAAEILAGFEARLGNTPEQERAEAVRQIARILLLRLQDRFEA